MGLKVTSAAIGARAILVAIGLLCATVPAWALDLTLPGNATLTKEVIESADSYFLPTGPYRNGEIPAREVEGRVELQAWRIEAQNLTTLQILAPLREQLEAAGYEIAFDCVGGECGGFDFRFNTRVLAAPDMFVDLFDYRFLSARNAQDAGDEEFVSLLISRSSATGYAQIIHVAPEDYAELRVASAIEPVEDATEPAATHSAEGPLAARLLDKGHVVLAGLEFESGSAALGTGPYASLAVLADFLKQKETRQVVLVGHTDAVGDHEGNLSLSRLRAASVLERLAVNYDVPRTQMQAEGLGYLAPIDSNLTDAGREANRRVEAVLLSED